MSQLKTEIRLNALGEIGQALEDCISTAKNDLLRLQGARQALRDAATAISGVSSQVDVDTDSEKAVLTLEQAKVIKGYLQRCADEIDKRCHAADVTASQFAQRLTGVEASLDIVKRRYDLEKKKLEVVECARGGNEEALISNTRPVGVHPGPSIAAQRKMQGVIATPVPKTRKRRSRGNV